MKYKVLFYTEEFITKNQVLGLLYDIGYSQESDYDVKCELVTSFDKTSFVDGVCEILNENGDLIDKFCVEITQTTDKESRNTSSYQRLIKFLFAKIYLPDYRQIMYFREKFTCTTNTCKIGLSILKLMGVEIINVSISDYLNLEELILLKNKISKKNPSNVPLYVEIKEEYVELSGKLKNGNNWSDPNIGFISSIIYLLKNEGHKNFKLMNHCMEEKKLKNTNNKLKKLISTFSVSLSFDSTNVIWNNDNEFTASNNYFKILEVGEKLSMINFLNFLVDKNYEVYFSNIAGCERGKVRINKKIYTLPKKMRIPDLIVHKNGNIYFIEGECKKNINKGLEQLTTFGECVKFICDVVEFKPEKIYTGVISDLYSTTTNDNYFGYFLNKEQNQIKNGIFC
jgi:hypothetical protein